MQDRFAPEYERVAWEHRDTPAYRDDWTRGRGPTGGEDA